MQDKQRGKALLVPDCFEAHRLALEYSTILLPYILARRQIQWIVVANRKAPMLSPLLQHKADQAGEC